MSQLKDLQSRAFSRYWTGRSTAPAGQYPRAPFPTIAALLIDPAARTIRTVYIRATASGLRSIFNDARVTFTDKPFLRAYGTNQYHEEITTRATLPNARLSVQGKVLVTGPKFTDIILKVSDEIMRHTRFSWCDAYEVQRLKLGYSSNNFSK
jgi:hypothetical protein